MTILRSGATQKYSDNWAKGFRQRQEKDRDKNPRRRSRNHLKDQPSPRNPEETCVMSLETTTGFDFANPI